MKARMPPLVVAALATDVALLAQGTLTGLIAITVAFTALYVAFRAAPVTMLLTSLVIAALLGAGVVATAQIPAVAQVSDVAAAAKQWSAERTHAASCAYHELPLVEQNATGRDPVDPSCPQVSAPNGYLATPGAW